jgi:hypothetical protein
LPSEAVLHRLLWGIIAAQQRYEMLIIAVNTQHRKDDDQRAQRSIETSVGNVDLRIARPQQSEDVLGLSPYSSRYKCGLKQVEPQCCGIVAVVLEAALLASQIAFDRSVLGSVVRLLEDQIQLLDQVRVSSVAPVDPS